ncbi:MAG: CAP domain-containing protein [Chthoniobacteraceae bacterium]
MILRFLFALTFLIAAAAHGESLPLQVLEEVNLARAQPLEYAQIIATRADNSRGSEGARAVTEAVRFLQKARPLPPLAWSPGISQAALSHALDLGPRGGTGHTSSRGESPWDRMARFGQWQGHAGENIDYGHSDARSIVISLLVDNGVPSRLHRANIFSRNFRVTGIAVAPHARSGSMCVMDFASRFFEAGEERVATRGIVLRSSYSGMSFF